MAGCTTFNGVQIGDLAWVQISTDLSVEIHRIPRADGAIIRRKGGGLKTLIVNAWMVRDNRFQVEQYFTDLASNLTSSMGDLIVNGKTYQNCLLDSISPSGEHNRWATFSVTFIQSG